MAKKISEAVSRTPPETPRAPDPAESAGERPRVTHTIREGGMTIIGPAAGPLEENDDAENP